MTPAIDHKALTPTTLAWREVCQRINITVTDRQSEAMDELERRGLRFCCDFGYQNAVEMAFGPDNVEYKEIPFDVTQREDGVLAGMCPCGRGMVSLFDYCPECGTRLDWDAAPRADAHVMSADEVLDKAAAFDPTQVPAERVYRLALEMIVDRCKRSRFSIEDIELIYSTAAYALDEIAKREAA